MAAQRVWRRIGAASLAVSAVMAWYAARRGILRSTVYHLTSLFSSSAPDLTGFRSGWHCLVFWFLFSSFVSLSLYMAMLDLRFIRMQYHVAKRDLFQETLGDKSFREALKSPSEKRR